MAMRAHIPCITAIIGVEMRTNHSIEYPVVAPATEYVDIPEGSSSDAPAISPGPSARKNRAIGANGDGCLNASASAR